jgi:hypothetical protein
MGKNDNKWVEYVWQTWQTWQTFLSSLPRSPTLPIHCLNSNMVNFFVVSIVGSFKDTRF